MAELRAHKNREGFTLLELMISIFLVLLVTLIALGAMRISFRSVTWGDRNIDFQERFRAALPIMETQILSGLPVGPISTGPGNEPEKFYFSGGPNEMQFSTNYSIWDGRQGYLLVSYKVVQGPGGKKALHVSEKTIGMQARREAVLLESMDEIYFNYFSANALESGVWVSQWKEEGDVPEKIGIHIFSRNRDFSLVVPMRVKHNLVRTFTAAVSPAIKGRAINTGLKNVK